MNSLSSDRDGTLLDLIQQILVGPVDPCSDVLGRAQGGALQLDVTYLWLDQLVRRGAGVGEHLRER